MPSYNGQTDDTFRDRNTTDTNAYLKARIKGAKNLHKTTYATAPKHYRNGRPV